MSTELKNELIIDNVKYDVTSGKSVNNRQVPAVIRVIDIKNPQTLEAFKKAAEQSGFTGTITRGVKFFENGNETDKFFSIDIWEKAHTAKAEANPLVVLTEKLQAAMDKFAAETNPVIRDVYMKMIVALSAEIDSYASNKVAAPVQVAPPQVAVTPVVVPPWGNPTV
jgi:hypothetical protein